MANRTLYPSWSYGASRNFIDFELIGAGAAAPTLSSDARQCVATVSRSSAGVYVVTLRDSFGRVVRGDASLDDTLNDGGYATVGNKTNEGTASPLSFTVYVRAAAGTAAELALNRRLGISLVLRNGFGWGTT